MEKEKQGKEGEQKRMEAEREKKIREESKHKAARSPAANLPPMEPVTHGAYGGGMYGTEAEQPEQKPRAHERPASETQSADGLAEFAQLEPKHTPPPSSGDRDIDITGQSYIQ